MQSKGNKLIFLKLSAFWDKSHKNSKGIHHHIANLWIFRKWAFKLSLLLNLLPQFGWSQWNGFSLECDLMCLLTCSGRWNLEPHNGHSWFFLFFLSSKVVVDFLPLFDFLRISLDSSSPSGRTKFAGNPFGKTDDNWPLLPCACCCNCCWWSRGCWSSWLMYPLL